jgi:hypothetical protein
MRRKYWMIYVYLGYLAIVIGFIALYDQSTLLYKYVKDLPTAIELSSLVGTFAWLYIMVWRINEESKQATTLIHNRKKSATKTAIIQPAQWYCLIAVVIGILLVLILFTPIPRIIHLAVLAAILAAFVHFDYQTYKEDASQVSKRKKPTRFIEWKALVYGVDLPILISLFFVIVATIIGIIRGIETDMFVAGSLALQIATYNGAFSMLYTIERTPIPLF